MHHDDAMESLNDYNDYLYTATWLQRAWAKPYIKLLIIVSLCIAVLSPILWQVSQPSSADPNRVWKMPEDEIPEPPPPKVNAAWFKTSAQFTPMGEPEPGEWLHQHKERGQSHKRYIFEQPNMPDETRHTLYILPVGDFHKDGLVDLDVIAQACEIYFEMPTRVMPAWHPSTQELTRRDTSKGEQWLSDDLIEGMIPKLPEDGYAMLGVTMTDIWPGKGWNYVFGSARLRDRVGIQSFVRYDPAFYHPTLAPNPERQKIIMMRGLQVMTHEFGHMFGIRHCTAYKCNMNGSNSIEEADQQPIHMCPVCLQKLQHAVGFEPDTRYQNLAKFYRAQGLELPATWVDQRRAEVMAAP